MAQPKVYATRTWPDSVWQIPDNQVFNPPASGESVRFDIETRGPWQTVSKVRGLAILHTGHDAEHFEPFPNQCQIVGVRTLSHAKESGYAMEGKVSANGRTYRAFTSSILCQAPGGKLCDVAVLYLCQPKGKE